MTSATEKNIFRNPKGDPYKVTQERLCGGDAELTCFFFHRGANLYGISYLEKGRRRHTLIDTGDPLYQDKILGLLRRWDIEPRDIDRIIITHRHPDHCGLAPVLTEASGTEIWVHPRFKSFIEGPLTEMERLWLQGFEPSLLSRYRLRYLTPPPGNPQRAIHGLAFPLLAGPIPLGDSGRLEILACPESPVMHSPDQLIVSFFPGSLREREIEKPVLERPAAELLFSGDLWLMHGPLFSKSFRALSLRIRLASRHWRGALKGQKFIHRDPRQQDLQAKEALKRGFSLIRVLPGHGEDFIGTRMVPRSFLCSRDLLVELGFPLEGKKSLLRSPELAEKITALREKAYQAFLREIRLWKERGYRSEEISELLLRIYREQEGGGPLVREDRKERRKIIRSTLERLLGEEEMDPEWRHLARRTLERIEEAP